MHIWLLALWMMHPGAGDRGIDVLHYGFHVRLFDEVDRIEVEALLRFRAVSATATVRLDLVGAGSDTGTGMTVSAARMGAHALPYTHKGDMLTLQMPAALQPGTVYEVTVAYAGVPADGLIISRNRHGARTFFADNWPNRAHHWLACVDHPGDKATTSFQVEVPAAYRVVANGTERGRLLDDTRATYHWACDVDLPTKVMVIGAARFAVEELGTTAGVPLSSWVFPEERVAGFKGFAPAAPILTWLTDYIGPFPYPALANVQSRTRFGGMENAGAVFYNENVFDSDAEGLLAHEIAHQWFGDSVSETDWPHIWLSEGFATYFSWRYRRAVHGDAVMEEALAEARPRILAYAAKHPGKTIVRTETDHLAYLGAYSYQKGGYVLHMLQQLIGEDAFRRGIRGFYRRYRDTNADSPRFETVMEEAADRDLTVFFEQWLHRPGQPSLEVTHRYDSEAGMLHLHVTQGDHPPYTLRLPIALTVNGTRRVEVVTVDQATQDLTLPTPRPESVTVNPGGALLLDTLTVKGI